MASRRTEKQNMLRQYEKEMEEKRRQEEIEQRYEEWEKRYEKIVKEEEKEEERIREIRRRFGLGHMA